MAPYLTILAINAAAIGTAYGFVYPRLVPLTARRMMRVDAVITALALAAAGLIYAGDGIAFDLGPVALKWWGFSLFTLVLIEAPVFWAFCQGHGISLNDVDAPARLGKD